MFADYKKETEKTKLQGLVASYFYTKWREVMAKGVTDPDTSITYSTHVRVNHCRGFSTCDDCSLLQAMISLAKHMDEQEKFVRLLEKHHQEVADDRQECARIARACKIYPNHVGFMIDAMDKHKMGVPTTEAQAKCLGKMPRIVQKLTGCQSFKDDSLFLFRTLPDVPTGGNLTLTIVTHLFTLPEVQQATDLYLNVDGASDNICYHVLYGLAYLLKQANKAGWPLQRIHILRFKACTYAHAHTTKTHTHAHLKHALGRSQVGHTHNQLDGTFGLLSRHTYGHNCGGTTGRDVLSFTGFYNVRDERYMHSCLSVRALIRPTVCRVAVMQRNSRKPVTGGGEHSWRVRLEIVPEGLPSKFRG